MQVGDLVYWIYTHSTLDIERRRLGIIVEKHRHDSRSPGWPSAMSTSRQFWRVLIDGEIVNIQEECLEVVNES